MSRRTKPFVWAALALALLIGLFSFPGPRALASEFLGLFRVQKFAPISISPEQLAQLEELDIEGLYPGEFEMITEPGDPQRVSDLAEASELTGLEARTLSTLGDPSNIYVMDGAQGRLTINLADARAILEIAGVDPQLLPDELDGAEIDVTSYPTISQRWRDDEITLVQMTSPEVNYPDSFEPAAIGQALLQLLGMSSTEAALLARSIDWTNTLLLPIPQEFATFGEVSINGTNGLIIEAVDGRGASILWETEGIVYFVESHSVEANALVQFAESLR